MRKIIKWMMVLVMAVGCAAAMTIAAEAATEGDFTYSVSGGKATVTGYVRKPTGALVIPDTLGGYPVTAIGDSALHWCSGLTSVTIPESVTSIGSEAFYWCSGLTSVTIPESVTSIGSEAFYCCNGLKSVTIPNSVTSIGGGAFKNCTGLTSVTIPKGVTTISGSTFWECTSLTSVTIPEGVTSIGGGAFYGCSRLTRVTIPNSVTEIAAGAFQECKKLEEITLPFIGLSRTSGIAGGKEGVFGAIFGYSYVDSYNSSVQGAIYQYNNGKEWYHYYIPSTIRKVTITDATMIPKNAFYNCSMLTEIGINEGITSINDAAFSNCRKLTKVNAASIESWYRIKFAGNTANPLYYAHKLYIDGKEVTNITIPEGVTSIGGSAFRYCTSLTSVTIPESLTSIDADVFFGCTGLTRVNASSIESWCRIKFGTYYANPLYYAHKLYIDGEEVKELTIPDSVTGIGNSAFAGCDLTSVTIPDSVTSIGDSAFYGCTSLEEITLPFVGTSKEATEKNGVFGAIFGYTYTSNKNSSVDGAVYQNYYDSYYKYYYYYIPSTLRKVTITDAAQIPENAFYNCSMLTEVNINEGITKIGYSAFYNCTGITEITIPDSVTSIGGGAFSGCARLTEITIPKGVTTIGGNTFSDCTGLTEITIPEGVTSIGGSAFSGCTGLTSVTIPDSVTEIGESAFSGCTGLTNVTIPDSVKSIWGSAFSGCTGLTSVTIPDSVTRIGSRAFSGCTGLTSVTILGGVASIGDYAFSGCTSLTSVTVPNSVTSIGNSAFSDCTGLTSVTIPNSVTGIGYSAFSGCTGLTSVTIPDSVTSIGNSAFSGCTGLTSVTIQDSVTSVGKDIFKDCDNLTEANISTQALINDGSQILESAKDTLRKITLTSGTKIDDNAFSGYTALEEVILPDELTEIGSNAFANCEKLSKISIPGSVETIGGSAFLGCSTLSKINIPGSVRTIGDGAFADCGRIRTVTLADGLETVGKNAFKNCGMVRKLTIPDSVTEIGDGAFYGCNSLEEISVPFVGITESSTGADAVFGAIFGRTQTGETEVTLQYPGYYYYIPNSLKKVTVTSAEILPEFAFRNCRRFTKINLTDGLLKIDSSAFESCDALSEITIPDSVTDIADYAFYDCGGLKTVTLGTGIKTIGTDAFSGCKAIETAVYPGSADEWASVTVEDGNEDLTSKLARTYTYTFKNADGSVFDTGVIPYGTAIPLPEGEPEKANDEKFTYAFAGWAGYSEGMAIEGDITFEPEFEGTLNRYTYRFISNGEVVKEATADYGTVIEAPETAPEGEFPLIFSEWEGFTEGMELTGSIDFNAVFINRSFTVTPEGGEAVTVVYGDEFVLGFSNKPGQHFIGYFTGKDGEGDKITGSDGASLEPFTFDGDITVYPYYVEDLLEKIALLGDEAVRTGEDAVYKVRFATAREVSELYLEIRYPESLEFKATNILDAVSADLISSESADGFVTAVFKCVLSGEKTAFEAPVTPFEIVFGVGDGAEDFTIEILASSRMKGDEDFAFSEVFTAETKVNNVIPGDVTGDGVVTRSDLLRFAKYFSGFEVEIDSAAADVTGDGEVTRSDLLRLAKYFSGFDVKLGK